MDITIKQLGNGDIDLFTELIRLFEDVFEMENFIAPPAEHLTKVLNEKGLFVIVALSGTKVVGGLTAYTLLQYYSEQPLAYIYDLAIAKEFQRKGIGKQLIAYINNVCKIMGYEEVFVQADKADDYALDFYRSTGATEENVSHFYYSFISSKK